MPLPFCFHTVPHSISFACIIASDSLIERVVVSSPLAGAVGRGVRHSQSVVRPSVAVIQGPVSSDSDSRPLRQIPGVERPAPGITPD